MNIREINGDLLKHDAFMIGHQVNCQKVMGSGIALQIKEQYPDCYKQYMEFGEAGPNRLGKVCFWNGPDKIIANMHAQLYYGYDGKKYTSYDALWDCFIKIRAECSLLINTIDTDDDILTAREKLLIKGIAFPYKLGSDRGGARWNIVREIIEESFRGVEYPVRIIKREI